MELLIYNKENAEAAKAFLTSRHGEMKALALLDLAAKYISAGMTIQDIGLALSTEHDKNVVEISVEDNAPLRMDRDGSPIPLQGGMVRLLGGMCENIDKMVSNGLSVVFFGFNGAGKTHSAKKLLYTAISSGYTGYYINVSEFQKLYNKVTFSGKATELEERVLKHIMQCDMLVLDEVGKESLTEQFLIMFELLLKTRATKEKSTVLVSNLNMCRPKGKNPGNDRDMYESEFKERYGSSISDLLYQYYRIFQLSKKGEFRKKERKSWW